jgi:hypothetical protein
MATTTITSGICGFTTRVHAEEDADYRCRITIETDCPNMEALRAGLSEVSALRELSWKGDGPLVYELARRHLPHASCPVPSGVIKAVEVACKLALPADAVIKVEAD